MPNFDGGHYFLSVLVPIRIESVSIGDGCCRSHADLLRETLTQLPTARQNVVTRKARLNSPFARNTLNHLARFVVIDDVVYNGRIQSDAVLSKITGESPLDAQLVDRLRCSYLFFGADIDASGDGSVAVRAYTDALWLTMHEELDAVFRHCIGFDRVKDAQGFFDYIIRCQVETTMPFNDYWTTPIPAKSVPLKGIVGVSAVLALATVTTFLLQLFDVDGASWGWLSVLGAVLTVGYAVGLYFYLVTKGQTPFPTAPNSDLPSVLKALYLQQRFIDFAIDAQGTDAQMLYRTFGAFVDSERPQDVNGPTQEPGVIEIPAKEKAA
ncbi:MAG: hypothetical protein U9Q81_22500 [Pseudomonadota bacterium]|nr:hypothetical protein [Pseudomonadota bacterium]